MNGLVTMLMFLALLICGVCRIYIMDQFTLKQRKELIVNFYKVHRDEGVAYTVKHFLKQGVARSTTYIQNSKELSGKKHNRKEDWKWEKS